LPPCILHPGLVATTRLFPGSERRGPGRRARSSSWRRPPVRRSPPSSAGSIVPRDSATNRLDVAEAKVVEEGAEEAFFLGGQVPLRLLLQHREDIDRLSRQDEVLLELPRLRIRGVAEMYQGGGA